MNCDKIFPLCVILCASIVAAGFESEEFSSEPLESLDATATLTSATGRSETHCAIQCAAAGTTVCAATAFVSERRLCLFSAVRNADFSAAAPGSLAYQIGWMDLPYGVMPSRSSTRVSFARTWAEYEYGFGDGVGVDGWLGLQKIHEMTGSTPRRLRMEAVTWSDVLYVCVYSGFSVGNASTNYTMTFDSYLPDNSNTSSDSLAYHKGMQFSTMDRDNDLYSSSSCSTRYGNAGWWFKSCYGCNPTGIYFDSRSTTTGRYCWPGADGSYSLKSMKLQLLF